MWKLIPVRVEGVFTPLRLPSEKPNSSSLPPDNGDTAGQAPAYAQHAEFEHNDFGTVVTEVTTVTTSTRRRYRVEDA